MDGWFKVTSNYHEDEGIATVDDAAEVMFVRGLAYCRRAKTGGYIPESALHTLTRHPEQAKSIATQLTRKNRRTKEPGLWIKVKGGYEVRSWAVHNDAADKLEERRKSDRERQQRRRETNRRRSEGVSQPVAGLSRDLSRDESRDVTDPEKEREEEAAAAATPAPPPQPLPPELEILRAALEAQRLVVRWDRLTPEQITEITELVATHGDTVLVKAAVQQFQPNRPAAFVQAWLPGWRDLRRPGDLAVVAEPCTLPGHSGTVRHCAQCASEQLEQRGRAAR